MTAKKKLTLGYSPWGNGSSIYPFDDIFENKQDIKVEGFAGVDCVILWGGEDIHPSLYGEEAHRLGCSRDKPSERDLFELKTITYCRVNDIPLIGVCRGAQMLCVGAGGKLVQHTNCHSGPKHGLVLRGSYDGKTVIQTNSVHHQMMYPFEVPHTMMAWTADGQRSMLYEGGGDKEIKDMWQRKEPEIVYFPSIRGLAIQGHPEYANAPNDFVTTCLAMVRDELGF